MSTTSSTVALNNGQQAIINTDTSKIFIGRNKYDKNNYLNNSGYNPLTLLQGTVMGRVASSGVLKPCSAQAADGSQFPIGILAADYTADAGETLSGVFICVEGDVVEERCIFFLGDTMETVVSSRRMRDRIGSDTVGINLVPQGDEMTGYDNQ